MIGLGLVFIERLEISITNQKLLKVCLGSIPGIRPVNIARVTRITYSRAVEWTIRNEHSVETLSIITRLQQQAMIDSAEGLFVTSPILCLGRGTMAAASSEYVSGRLVQSSHRRADFANCFDTSPCDSTRSRIAA